ncbi:hypothetical protein [Aliikangiella sp. G2MR2-5]|uniref:hypothetical protein n=1 Tax=Aliikangiella sp. G2MR2-5 TaxID=2788943 RepID=UPI0018A8E82F|nr:hypothetical protein [Aliikangiella sp. G2MR2-5]
MNEQNQLENLAAVSLFDSQDKKDEYLQNAIDWLLSADVNAISGAYITSDNNKAQISSRNNAVLACWLLSCGRALFSGELIQYGKLLIEYLDKNLWLSDKNLFSAERELVAEFDQVSSTQVMKVLSEDEIRLLDGYLSIGDIKTKKSIPLYFRCFLNEAARHAGVHIKQAQVIDGSMRQKLASIFAAESSPINRRAAELVDQAIIYSCMTQAQLWHGREISIQHYQRLGQYLFEQFTLALDTKTNILLLHALLESLQLESNEQKEKSLLKIVSRNMEALTIEPITSPEALLLSRCNSIIQQLNKSIDLSLSEAKLDSENALKPVELVRVTTDPEQNEKIKLNFFEKYHLNKMLIPY